MKVILPITYTSSQIHAPWHHVSTWNSDKGRGIYTTKMGKHYKSGLFPPESQLLNTYQHTTVPICVSATFPTLFIDPVFLPENEGSEKWHSCCYKKTCNLLLTKKVLVPSSVFPLSSDHYSVYYCIWGQPPMGIWLFITSESFSCTVICQAFIYSRPHLIEIWKMAWTLNDKQMRRSDENHTCLNTMCFHMKYIWDF